MFQPLLFEVVRLPLPDPRKLAQPIDNPSQFFLKQLEDALELHSDEVAAVILEPMIQAAAGMIFHPEGYLSGVRKLTQRFNTLLITDEIVTGFGRTGRMFACEHENVVPDILCLGKSMTGGYLPLSAAIASPEIYQAFLGTAVSGRAFYHGHTYGGNQLCTAAAVATLDILSEEFAQDDFELRKEKLKCILQTLLEHPHVCEVRQKGLIAAVELTPQPGKLEPYPSELRIGARICETAKELGLWLRPLRDTLVIMPPLNIQVDELEFMGNALLQSIDKATSAAIIAS